MKVTVLKGTLLAVTCTCLIASNAFALPYGSNSGAALQGVLDGITQGGPSSVNVNTDYLDDMNDSSWNITASGGSVATLVIELAGFASGNTFGVYNSSNYVELFGGAASTGSQVTLSLTAFGNVYVNHVDTGVTFAGTDFGYYLDSSTYTNGGLFHSDSSLNVDGLDHMAAYQGTNTDTVQIGVWGAGTWTNNEYVLAFEDLLTNPDWDYTDMVVMVESVEPVPEPSTMLLFGAGLAGFAGIARRKRMNK